MLARLDQLLTFCLELVNVIMDFNNFLQCVVLVTSQPHELGLQRALDLVLLLFELIAMGEIDALDSDFKSVIMLKRALSASS